MTLRSNLKLAATLALTTAVGAGCLGYGVTNGNGDPDAGVAVDGAISGPKPDMAIDIHAEFDTKVRPLLSADCGTCHSQSAGGVGPGFLAGSPDMFTTVISFPGLIGVAPESSRLLLKDAHVGPSYHMTASYTPTADLAAHAVIIADWIRLYNSLGGLGAATGADLAVKARIEPFVPVVGTKTIDLGALDPSFTGSTISFDIAMVGSTQLKLSNIKITAGGTGVHVKTPVFATYAPADLKVAIDINYDYLSKDYSTAAGGTVMFSPSLTFMSYTAGQLINVSFNTLEVGTGGSDMGGAVTGCKDLTAFAAFMPRLTAAQPGMNNACSAGACHGQNGGTGGLNLNGIAATNAAVCSSVLNNIIVAAPGSSPLYLHPTDATNHAGGKITAGQARTDYLTDLTTFANAQK